MSDTYEGPMDSAKIYCPRRKPAYRPRCLSQPSTASERMVLALRLEGLDRFKELCGRGHVGRGEDNRVSARAVDARNV